jgi:hypothetical protein
MKHHPQDRRKGVARAVADANKPQLDVLWSWSSNSEIRAFKVWHSEILAFNASASSR